MAVAKTKTPGQDRVRRLRKKGWAPRRIAEHLGISTQRVYKILGPIGKERGNGRR